MVITFKLKLNLSYILAMISISVGVDLFKRCFECNFLKCLTNPHPPTNPTPQVIEIEHIQGYISLLTSSVL